MDSFEKNGVFFLPENPSKEITGILQFSPNKRSCLKLVGEFADFQALNEKLENSIEYPIINGWLIGKSGSSKEVTLLNSRRKREFKTGIQTTEVYPQIIIHGHHFSSIEEVLLPGIVVHFEHLEEWVNKPNVEIRGIPDSQNQNSYTEVIIKQNIQPTINIGQIVGFTISIVDTPWVTPNKMQLYSFFGVNTRNIELNERKKILIKSDSPKPLKDFLEAIHLLQEFLTFACGQVILPDFIESGYLGKTTEYDSEEFSWYMHIMRDQVTEKTNGEELNPPKIIKKEVDKIFPLHINFQTTSSKLQDSQFEENSILLRFTHIEENPEIVLASWKNFYDQSKPILEIYMRIFYTPMRHIHDVFLSLTQAIEGFHRIRCSGEYCDKATFQTIKDSLKETFQEKLIEHGVTEDFHDSLLNKVNYWNEFSLKERLEDMFRDQSFLSCLPSNFFEDEVQQDKFAKVIRDTRGHLTHPSNPSKTNNVASNTELGRLNKQLKIILEISFLKELKIEDLVIKKIIEERYV